MSMHQLIHHTLPALHQLKKEGKVKHIGITGHNLGILKRVVELAEPGMVDTVLCYCRYNLVNKGQLQPDNDDQSAINDQIVCTLQISSTLPPSSGTAESV